MIRIGGVLLLSVLFLSGCRQAPQSPSEAILLSLADQAASKTDALAVGDEVAVFARIEGTERYFLESAKFVVGSDGQSLSTSPTPYYPEAKQAVAFFAYFPYHTGIFSVPSDQSTAAALKQADLCWASAKSTPVTTPVGLEFRHLLARLIVQTNTPTTKIACQVVPSGTLNPATGHFSLGSTKSEVFTTNNEFIVPPQPFSRMILTVSGVEYTFEGSISLEAGTTTTLNLTLNSATHTATLNGSSITNWSTASKSDEPDLAVSNQFTAHWLVADYRFNQINKIALTIKDQTTNTTKDYAVSNVSLVSGSTVAAASYTFTLAKVPELHYPYTVSAIKFSKDATLVHTATVSHNIVRTGAVVLGWGQNIALTLSTDKASVSATTTSSTFTVTSNVPYTSSYTTGGASAQGTGVQPPYTNYSVTFTYPAQGSTAAAERKHVMTITPTEDYTGSPNKRTFTVTQAAVPTSLALSATAPGETVPRLGKTYLVNVSSNTSWKSQSAVNGVTTNPASGTGSVTGVQVIVPYTVANATTPSRTVSVDFVTTAGLSGVTEKTVKWSGTQNASVPANAILINGVWWAIGNLIANGANGCKIGASTDCGLYFQFGSLVGWSGGAAATGYDGRGAPTVNNATVKVTPSNLHSSFNTGGSWPTGGSTATLNKSYFSVTTAPYSTLKTEIWGYNGAPTSGVGVDVTRSNLLDGRYAPTGVGDPCRFYLGAPWRLPSVADVAALVGRDLGWGIPMVGTTTAHTPSAWVAIRSGLSLSGPWSYERTSATLWVTDRKPNNGGECAIFETAAIHSDTYRIECHWHLGTPNGVFFHGDPASSFGTRTHGVVVRCVQSL